MAKIAIGLLRPPLRWGGTTAWVLRGNRAETGVTSVPRPHCLSENAAIAPEIAVTRAYGSIA